jgi:hypothetical protein
MLYNLQVYNLSTLWLLLFVCMFDLPIRRVHGDEHNGTKYDANTKQLDEFPHLLHIIGPTQRVHIVSEVVHDGRRFQVEEYLDLRQFSQLIQFKWHDDGSAAQDNGPAQLKTNKLNTLLLNGNNKSALYHYEPYRCAAIDLNELDLNGRPAAPTVDAKTEKTQTDDGVWATTWSAQQTTNSPFLTKLELGDGASAKWVSGIAGLWLKATKGASNKKPPYHPKYITNNNLVIRTGSWQLELTDDLIVEYYTDKVSGRGGVESFDVPTLILLKDKNKKTIQTINIFNIEFNYSDQLDKNLFTLPIGFNCPANVLHSGVTNKIYFEYQRSQFMKFELVTTRWFDEGSAAKHLTDVKNIELARVKHPIDPNESVSMFRSLEDRTKIIHDNSYKLEYKILAYGMSHHCSIEHLQFKEGVAKDNDSTGQKSKIKTTSLASINPIRLEFGNTIHLDLNEYNMDFVLGLHESDMNRMRLLNVFDVSDDKSELVFESEVPDEHNDMVVFASTSGFRLNPKPRLRLRIIRVYEQQWASSGSNGPKKNRRGMVEFSRAIILVFNSDTSRKLAEIRLNLVDSSHLMSMSKRAQLFDVSQCRDLEHESMQLVAYYPADPDLLQSINEQGHEILDSFYRSSMDWLQKTMTFRTNNIGEAIATDDDDDDADEVLRKRRLGASLNFLRVPKVELKLSPVGELEMHLTIIEKNSPLDVFEHLPNSYFTADDQHDQNVLVGSLRECAHHCLLANCKVFAFQTGRQCKLSQLSVGQPNEGVCFNGTCQTNPTGQEPVAGQTRRFAKLTMSPTSEVYYEPAFIGAKHIGEASLAELSSYVEHINDELDEFMASLGGDEDASRTNGPAETTIGGTGSAFTTRHKRSTWPLGQPLFVFDFLDRSGLRSEYEPPRRRSLVPSELAIKSMPQVLDVRALAQANKVDHTFRVKYVGKSYKMTACDPPQASSAITTVVRDPDERVFIDKAEQTYYTLKKWSDISQDNCALICYSTAETDMRTSSEQICESFSYSKLEQECILLIKTDFKFVSNILDLVEEGDIVHSIDSIQALIVTHFDGIIAIRRNLAKFEGPLELELAAVGARSTDLLRNSERASRVDSLEIEWLAAIVVEGENIDDDQGEECAKKCAKQYRSGNELCLALDYCFTSNLAAAGALPASSVGTTTIPMPRRRATCNLLLIRNAYPRDFRTDKAKLNQVSWLRTYLAQATRLDQLDGAPANGSAAAAAADKMAAMAVATNCNRYLTSYLSEFNRLTKRQLNKNSRLVASKLEMISESLVDTNQERCAMECSLGSANCLLFELCHRVASDSGQLEQSCSLFKRTPARDNELAHKDERRQEGGADSVLLATQPTSYHDGCHVYLRREFETLEQALSDQSLDKLLARQQATSPSFGHAKLSAAFALAYLACTLGFVVCTLVQRRRQKNAASSTADQQPPQPFSIIMMDEMNGQQRRQQADERG